MYEAGISSGTGRHTPINNGTWSGERGNSIWIPGDKSVLEDIQLYSEGMGHRVNGIEYRDGYADFSPVAIYTTTLSELLYERTDESQFLDCALDMRSEMEDNARLIPPDRSIIQWFDGGSGIEIIGRGQAGIPGYTWHHDTQNGRIQLVPTSIHRACLHEGGRSLWGGGQGRR